MMKDIAPGSRINLKVIKSPTNAAATKTLTRLLSKDKAVQAENRRHRNIRAELYAPRPRGGRTYAGRLVKQHPVKGVAGESATLTASVDVLRDLASVSRFVEITKA